MLAAHCDKINQQWYMTWQLPCFGHNHHSACHQSITITLSFHTINLSLDYVKNESMTDRITSGIEHLYFLLKHTTSTNNYELDEPDSRSQVAFWTLSSGLSNQKVAYEVSNHLLKKHEWRGIQTQQLESTHLSSWAKLKSNNGWSACTPTPPAPKGGGRASRRQISPRSLLNVRSAFHAVLHS